MLAVQVAASGVRCGVRRDSGAKAILPKGDGPPAATRRCCDAEATYGPDPKGVRGSGVRTTWVWARNSSSQMSARAVGAAPMSVTVVQARYKFQPGLGSNSGSGFQGNVVWGF